MKKLTLIFLAVIALIGASTMDVAAENVSSARVIAYYFHGSFRCHTCTSMEKYYREAIETNFKDALASGKLDLKVVNTEDRGNEHFVDDYKLFTKSIILSLVKDGKEVKSKNLDKIWEYSRNKRKFIDYVASEVSEFMKDAQ